MATGLARSLCRAIQRRHGASIEIVQGHKHLGRVLRSPTQRQATMPLRTVVAGAQERRAGACELAVPLESHLGTLATLPNLITVARISATPLLGSLVADGHFQLALVGCAIAAASDWLDGFIARLQGSESVLGSYLDPLADKVLIVTLACNLGYLGILHPWLVGAIVARDGGLLLGTGMRVVVHCRQNGRENEAVLVTLNRMPLSVRPTLLSKVNTGAQFALIGTCLASEALGVAVPALVWGLSSTVLCTTALSGAQYAALEMRHDASQKPLQRC